MRFYLRLAIDSVRKNRKLYLPYLPASSLMVCMYYILVLIKDAGFVAMMRGGADLKFLLELGSWVILLFAVLFLFYTNAFLIRSRKKEFGLYSVLGMSRGGILKLYFLETVLISVLTIAAGIVFGICFSKLAELLLAAVIDGEVNYRFAFSLPVIGRTAALFAVIDLVIFAYCAVQITKATAVSLLKSENFGEKPPKANWFPGLAGLVILGAAYYIAVTIGHPVEALVTFFVAVLMVILATYLLFISGSVLLCRILQKKKSFYYKPENFVTVSTMAYRMKRNGAGLASICILLTMVLVMISSSACLYFGREEALRGRCPRDISLSLNHDGCSEEDAAFMETVFAATEKSDAANKIVPGSRMQYGEYCISGLMKDGKVSFDTVADIEMTVAVIRDITKLHLISLETYNRLSGTDASVGEGEILLFDANGVIKGDRLYLGDCAYRIAARPESVFAVGQSAMLSATNDLYIITADPLAMAEKLSSYRDGQGSRLVYLHVVDEFDTEIKGVEGQEAVLARLRADLEDTLELTGERENCTFWFSCYEVDRADFYHTFGGLFFIGIMLSVVFLVAAALMIYYKQVSEGYEDRARFAILQKVGMTEEDIRASIRSQMRLVFFLPIVLAVIHLAFAFPLIFKSLLLFGVSDLGLLILTSAGSAVLCTILYWFCYKATGEAYYRIVR